MKQILYNGNLRFEFNKIYIIESLENEWQTGKELYEFLLNFNYDTEFEPIYVNINNKEEWEHFFTNLAIDCESNGCKPILHFEMHGNPVIFNGKKIDYNTEVLDIKDIDHITLGDFARKIRNINKLSGFNLFISMGVCYGLWQALSSLSLMEPMPFFAAIGSQCKLYNNDILKRYTKFYESLITNLDLNLAFQELESVNPFSDRKYKLHDASSFFLNAYRKYLLKRIYSPIGEALKALGLVWRIEEYNFLIPNFIFLEKESRQKDFLNFRDIYYCLEECPENTFRFQIPNYWQEVL